MRSAVLKAAWFMDKAEYTEKLEALNAELKACLLYTSRCV